MSNGDPVNHPVHYQTEGGLEVIEVIEDWQLGFHVGNALKYILRAGKKDAAKAVEDLRKAVWYLERYQENYDSQHGAPDTSFPISGPKVVEVFELRYPLNGAVECIWSGALLEATIGYLSDGIRKLEPLK